MYLKIQKIIIVSFIMLITLPDLVLCEETYVFERMWPTLQQPWYLHYPSSVAIDSKGNIYICAEFIHKLTQNGQLITKWNTSGCTDIAIDESDNIYLTIPHIDDPEGSHPRVAKYTQNGQLITEWGVKGTENGQFLQPVGVAIDNQNNVYVVDRERNCVQKFSDNGQFITKWGSEGSADGQFKMPFGITIDENGIVWVVDTGNHRIQKFTSNGEFISKWGEAGDADEQLLWPYGIAIDNQENFLISEGDELIGHGRGSEHRIKKFTSDGQLITKWGTDGTGEGQFMWPLHMAIDGYENVYVADHFHHQIQKFTAEGEFLTKFGATGAGEGQLFYPSSIALDNEGNVYVADSENRRIQKFTKDGQFLTQWGGPGDPPGKFMGVGGIILDAEDNVYVADSGNYIQKFSSEGQFITVWGGEGSGDGEFKEPYDVAIDKNGFVYVVDRMNHRIQKFNTDGQFVSKWGTYGQGDDQLDNPVGIAVDLSGNVYIRDGGHSGLENESIKKFSTEGIFIAKWNYGGTSGLGIDPAGNLYQSPGSNIYKINPQGQIITSLGSYGIGMGQFRLCRDTAVAPDGRIFALEDFNSRIQVFKKIDLAPKSKAIIVAGGGSFPGNNLWAATQMCANFAYRSMSYQGFTKETIYYLTSDTDLDLDNNGELDDVDGDATNSNLQHAITNWAADAESLVIYLTDHGGDRTFRMSGSEILNASDLDTWLDQLQQFQWFSLVFYNYLLIH